MGGMELEAQIGSHAFDGELGAGYGVNNRQRAVDHVAGGEAAITTVSADAWSSSSS